MAIKSGRVQKVDPITKSGVVRDADDKDYPFTSSKMTSEGDTVLFDADVQDDGVVELKD